VLDTLAKCFLVDGLPGNMREKMDEWKGKKLEVPAKSAKKWNDWDNYVKSLDEGWKQYESIWKKWKGPEGKR